MTNENERAEPELSDIHPELFHYTSLNAFKSILKSNTLFATAATCLNDSSEMELLWPTMKESCKHFIEASIKKWHPSLAEEAAQYAMNDGPMIVDVIRKRLLGTTAQPGMGIPFVTSFTTHSESYHRENGMLSQWRGYAEMDGVAIVFDTKKTEQLLKQEFERFLCFSCCIAKVVYLNDTIVPTKSFSCLFEALKHYVEYFIRRVNIDDVRMQRSLHNLTTQLLPAVGRLKHRGFEEENECRIIVGMPHESYHTKLLSDDENSSRSIKEVLYGTGPQDDKPFIKLFETQTIDDKYHFNLPVTKIVVGPSVNQCENLRIVTDIVKRHTGGACIKVLRSEIPYQASGVRTE